MDNSICENAEQTWCPLYTLGRTNACIRTSLNDDDVVIQNTNNMRCSLESHTYADAYLTKWIHEAKCEVLMYPLNSTFET